MIVCSTESSVLNWSCSFFWLSCTAQHGRRAQRSTGQHSTGHSQAVDGLQHSVQGHKWSCSFFWLSCTAGGTAQHGTWHGAACSTHTAAERNTVNWSRAGFFRYAAGVQIHSNHGEANDRRLRMQHIISKQGGHQGEERSMPARCGRAPSTDWTTWVSIIRSGSRFGANCQTLATLIQTPDYGYPDTQVVQPVNGPRPHLASMHCRLPGDPHPSIMIGLLSHDGPWSIFC